MRRRRHDTLSGDLIPADAVRAISMSPPMVEAIFRDAKTQTRRAIHPQPLHWDTVLRKPYALTETPRIFSPLTDHSEDRVCPYGVGDRLWVREAWRQGKDALGTVVYKSSFDDKGPWCNPMTMRRWAARLWLQVTSIRCEHLREITVEECIAEGLKTSDGNLRDQYQKLWDRLNRISGASWDTNPWVWVISFRRTESI